MWVNGRWYKKAGH
ncbi:MAG: hypothetical protein H6861_03115 [Rhodospirillales bacterium]|nr:hypothetical protein [Rhodospirillales bacterium]